MFKGVFVLEQRSYTHKSKIIAAIQAQYIFIKSSLPKDWAGNVTQRHVASKDQLYCCSCHRETCNIFAFVFVTPRTALFMCANDRNFALFFDGIGKDVSDKRI